MSGAPSNVQQHRDIRHVHTLPLPRSFAKHLIWLSPTWVALLHSNLAQVVGVTCQLLVHLIQLPSKPNGFCNGAVQYLNGAIGVVLLFLLLEAHHALGMVNVGCNLPSAHHAEHVLLRCE